MHLVQRRYHKLRCSTFISMVVEECCTRDTWCVEHLQLSVSPTTPKVSVRRSKERRTIMSGLVYKSRHLLFDMREPG